jgi:hypothetical protein
MAAFGHFPSRHFNLFTLLQRGYTLQTLVYQGCSTLNGNDERHLATPARVALHGDGGQSRVHSRLHVAWLHIVLARLSTRKQVRTALCSSSHEARLCPANPLPNHAYSSLRANQHPSSWRFV